MTTLLQIIGLVGHKQWAALASLAMLWLWHAAEDWSGVPLDKKWRPEALTVVGVVYGALQAVLGGMAPSQAALHGIGTAIFTYGLVAMTLDNYFGSKLPRWLATILLLFPQSPPPDPPVEAPTSPDRRILPPR